MTTKKTIYIDASALKESSCQRRLLYTIFYGYKHGSWSSNYKAGYGSAFHRALEYWYGVENKTEETKSIAIQKALDYYKPFTPYVSETAYEYRTSSHLEKSIQHYFKTYGPDSETLVPIKSNSLGLLESKFIYPAVLFDDRLDGGENYELIITGTIDFIGSMLGRECFADHKSTGFSYTKKDEFFREYDISIQMQLYTMILERLTGVRFPFLINGIFVKKPTKEAEKLKQFDGCNLDRSPLKMYPDGQMKEFEIWLRDKLLDLKLWLDHYYRSFQDKPANEITTPNFSACHPKWPCPYFSTCSQEPALQGRVLGLMNVEPYNPLLFSETLT